ncbi:MAG: glutamine--fructose-6-phosphate transaminase (isomerizing) [Desulfurococcaceae archaeon]
MCGIIGICRASKGGQRLGEILFRGLLRLEYRGYDSAGIAIIDEVNGRLLIAKGKGKLHELEHKYRFTEFDGLTGIGHTRWATHGPPSDINAHPHIDCSDRFAIVHNGIIENYMDLRNNLEKNGHVFKSETDTEVIAHLIEDVYNKTHDVYLAFKKAILLLRGSYAILMITPLEPQRIFFAKKDSPLVIGIGENGYNLIASDIPALLDYTRKIFVVKDYLIGYISPGEIFVENLIDNTHVSINDHVIIVEWTHKDAEKGGYPHFMLKEIYEQPLAIKNTLYGLKNDPNISHAVKLLSHASKIYVIGAGTSYHASEYFSLANMILTGKTTISFISSEYIPYMKTASPNDVLIAISQSGETMDTLKALRAFKKRGVKIISISNIIDSAIPRESDICIYTRAGPEIGVAATKTFLAQTLTLIWISIKLAEEYGTLNNSEIRELLEHVEKSPWIVEESIRSSERLVKNLAENLARRTKSMYYLSRGIGLPIAREGALKIKEIAYIHAEAYPAGESKHGPIALIENDFPVVFVIPPDDYIESIILGNIEEMKARGALTIGITSSLSKSKDIVDYFISIPHSHWILTPLTHTPPLQLLAYYVAVEKGYDPDKPRNLAKTVTVE